MVNRESEMYYVFNVISWFLTTIAISLVVCEKTAPSWLILILLFSAACFQFVASVWVVEKHDDLEARIKKLENMRKDK